MRCAINKIKKNKKKCFRSRIALLVLILSFIIFNPATVSSSFKNEKFTPLVEDSIYSNKPDRHLSFKTRVIPHYESQGRVGWNIFVTGFLGGIVAIFTPCVFPLLPLTVSFFMRKNQKRQSIKLAIIYGLFIIGLYVLLGLTVSWLFGSSALNAFSTSGVLNVSLFFLLIAFAASFFGAFELSLPSSFINSVNILSERSGLIGVFFMAVMLSLVTFSCTGPIVGTLLVDAAFHKLQLGPALGMFGFSLALSLPFTLFALFPSALKKIPKSGPWLNSTKVLLGFIELAFSLKFLSNADLAYHWGLLNRDVFLTLWISIFFMMGFYLLGVIKFSYDNNVSTLSFFRTFLSILTFAFVFYLLPGLWGAPLKPISAFLPPIATQDFDLYTNTLRANKNKITQTGKMYTHIFARATPLGLNAYYDYQEALQASKFFEKPVLLNFTGWGCINCRKMEASVWSSPPVLKMLDQDFILVELYIDDKTELPGDERYISSDGKHITTIGDKWSDFQAKSYHTNAQPYYVILNATGDILAPPQGANYDPIRFLQFLQSGKLAYEREKH